MVRNLCVGVWAHLLENYFLDSTTTTTIATITAIQLVFQMIGDLALERRFCTQQIQWKKIKIGEQIKFDYTHT